VAGCNNVHKTRNWLDGDLSGGTETALFPIIAMPRHSDTTAADTASPKAPALIHSQTVNPIRPQWRVLSYVRCTTHTTVYR
jgi:hypothetical protein